MDTLIREASAAICVCLYPVMVCGDGMICTNSAGKQLYLAMRLDNDIVFVHRFEKHVTHEQLLEAYA